MKLTIVGLGAIGTSLGAALREATTEIPVTGHDADPERVKRARALGAIDRSHWNLPAACEDADLVVLDLPLEEHELTLRALGDALKEGAVVLDVSPTQRRAMALAAELLPRGAHWIGAHPVSPGLSLGDVEPAAELLAGVPFYLVVPADSPEHAVAAATDLITAVGAEPHYVEAAEHDGLVAATEQLPRLAALAYLLALQAEAGRRDRAGFAGGGLLTLGLIVSGGTHESATSLLANRDHLLPWLDAYLRELAHLRDALGGERADELGDALERARTAATAWLAGGGPGEGEPSEGARSLLRRLFLGGLGRTPPGSHG